jgi:putative redox protein
MKSKIECRWLENMAFEAEVDDHTIIMDADEANGGNNLGPRPKPLTLVSLAGCTGIDVIALLHKMKVEPEEFSITVEGELTEDHPKYYERILVTYHFKGKDLPVEKIQKAISLSNDKYCGVSAMLRVGTVIDHEFTLDQS